MIIESVPGILKTNWKAPAGKTHAGKKNTTSEINWRSRRVETIELFVTTKQMSPLDEHQKRMASGIYLLS